MKACVLHGINDLRLEEVPYPVMREGEVIVKIKAAGICGSDLDRVFKSGTYHYPTIIGHEFSGEIVEEFSDGDCKLKGKKVTVFPLLPCFKCDSCIQGKYAQCRNYSYYGSRCDGGFAEYISVKKWNLFVLPDDISFVEGALFEPGAVSCHAISMLHGIVGKTIALIGVGAIGMITAQILKSCGADRVILIVRTEDKAAFLRNSGFDYVINSDLSDINNEIDKMTQGKGVDACIEGTGNDHEFGVSINITRRNGIIVCLGNPKGDFCLKKDVYWQILRKELSIVGTWNSSYKVTNDDWNCFLSLLRERKVESDVIVTDKYSLDECKVAFDDLYYRKKGKIRLKSMFINE